MTIEDYKRWYQNMLRRCNAKGCQMTYEYCIDGSNEEITLERIYKKTLKDVEFRHRFVMNFRDVKNEADLKNRMDAFCDELVMEKIEV